MLRIAAAVVLLVASAGAPAAEGPLDEFARCLTRRQTVLYGAAWCSRCEAQLDAFGTSERYLDYVECSATGAAGDECTEADVRAFPTWEFRDGSRLQGVVSLSRLAARTGCNLP